MDVWVIYQWVILVVTGLRNERQAVLIEFQIREDVLGWGVIFSRLNMRGPKVLFVVERGHVEG
jgi:hypothetical protein